jgi:F-type H+-transporting ATPase subunit delta
VASGAAKRYAQAVLDLAKERGTLDAWQADLARFDQLMRDPLAAQFFESPQVPDDRKRAVLEQALAGAQPEARNLARLLSERGRLGDVPRIRELFEEGLLAERGIAIADVTTADELGPAEQAAIGDQLARLVGKQIQLRAQVDPGIIGGIVARVGDQLIDGSVINQLRRLRARLAASA